MPKITEKSHLQTSERIWLAVKRHPNGISTTEVTEFVGLHERNVRNHLNKLKDEGKIDKEGLLWFALNYEETRLRSFDLSPEEAYTLYLGCRLFVKQHDKRNEPAESALLKLSEVLKSDADIGHEIAQAAKELAARPMKSGYQAIFGTIVRGYIHRKRLTIRYKPLKGSSFETTFDTYLIEPSSIGYATYMIGHSHLPDKLRAYKIERIESAELTRADYQVPSDFPGLEILQNSWSIIMGEGSTTVLLRFSRKVRERVLETQWHISQKTWDDEDVPNYLLWQAEVADTLDMEPWIRGWGADVEVLQPQELRMKISGQARQLAELYNWQTHRLVEGAESTSSLAQTFQDFFGGE